MKQYSKKAIGLILLIVITSLVLAFLVAGQFYISAFIAGMILLIEAWYLLRQMERSDRLSGILSGRYAIPTSFLRAQHTRNRRMPSRKN